MPAVGGSRPDRLPDVSGPQERVQRRTVQQIVDHLPLPILDDPAPQMVGQVVEVPKIPWIWTMRAEQLVEVPMIISFSSLQRTMEHNVGIPVVGGSGAGGGLSGFLPGQSYSFITKKIVDNPVPRLGGAGDLQGFLCGQGSTAFSEHIPEFPDPGGGDQDFSASPGLRSVFLGFSWTSCSRGF